MYLYFAYFLGLYRCGISSTDKCIVILHNFGLYGCRISSIDKCTLILHSFGAGFRFSYKQILYAQNLVLIAQTAINKS